MSATVAGLRERELPYVDPVYLHERYFGNLGGGGKAIGASARALAAQFGARDTSQDDDAAEDLAVNALELARRTGA